MANRSKGVDVRLTTSGGDKVRRDFKRLGKDGQSAFDKITRATIPANTNLKMVDASARALNSVLRQAAGLVGAYAGIQGISRSVGFLVTTNREFERLHASLKTVTGSAQGADKAFNMIEEFASSTPFNVGQITEAFIKLKALGLEPSQEALRSYGNTASAMGKDLMQFVDAVAGATTGELDRLKTFGITAQTQGDQIAFTFQGVSTSVGKNAVEIERYLRRIGMEQFAGAMAERMNTLDGIFSNIRDNMDKLAREAGDAGLNTALRDVSNRLKDATARSEETAQALGETLGTVVRTTADGLGVLVQNAETVAQGLGTLLIARAVGGAFTAMNVAMVSNAGAVVGLRLMAESCESTAAKMFITEGAARAAKASISGLRSVMMFLGGPAGLAVITGAALYNLARGHDAAGQAARDHAEEMEELRKTVHKAKAEVKDLNTASRYEGLARWTEDLARAQDNVRAVTQQLKFGEIGGFWDQFSRFGSVFQRDLLDVRRAFQAGKLSVDEYQEALWKLATKHPDFTDNVKGIQKQILALKAAEKAAEQANNQLKHLRSGVTEGATQTAKPTASQEEAPIPRLGAQQEQKIRSTIQGLEAETSALHRVVQARAQEGDAVRQALLLNEQENTLRRLGLNTSQAQSQAAQDYEQHIRRLVSRKYELKEADQQAQDTGRRHQKTVEDITIAYQALRSETERAVIEAATWRTEALAGLDQTRTGYDAFRVQIEDIYSNMLAEAREKDLQSSKHWEDGLKRGFRDVLADAKDMATQTEQLVKNAFKGMEDALVGFVTSGKLDFKSFADSIIADLLRIQVRQNITQPLSNALGSIDFGSLFGAAHTGGVIGGDALSGRMVHPRVFTHAPKFHSGGIVGNEVPIVAKRGETVFTPGQMRLLGAGLTQKDPVQVHVTVHNTAPGVQARAESTRRADGGVQLDVIVEQLEGQIARNIGRGQGIGPTIERRYGLSPVGNY